MYLNVPAVQAVAERAEALGAEAAGLTGHIRAECDAVRSAHNSWLSSLKLQMYADVCERNVQAMATELTAVGAKLREDIAETLRADDESAVPFRAAPG